MRGHEPAAATDQELLARVRGGDTGAYGELWRRHSGAVTAILRLETRLDPDDLTAEVFTRILAAIRGGNGPDSAFRPYALVAARNLAAEWGRRGRREIPVAEDALDAVSNEAPIDEAVVVLPHRHVAARVFSSLPVRWQEVLWYLEVEQLTAAEAAPLVGLNPNSTVQLAFRAREGFRQAWIQEHLSGRPAGTRDCAWVDRRVGRHVRGKLTTVERGKLERHAAACERCTALIDEGRSVERRVIFVLLPPLLLGGAATGYLAVAASGRMRRSDSEPGEPAVVRPARLAKRGGRTRSRPVAVIASAAGIAAAIVIVAAGVVVEQATVEPVESARAAGPAPSIETAAKPIPRAPVEPVLALPPDATDRGPQEDRSPSVHEPADPRSAPGSPPASSPPVPPVTPPAEPYFTVASLGHAFPSLSGTASPNAAIEAVLDPAGAALPLGTIVDAGGSFVLVVDASGLTGTVELVVRQIAGGIASEWTAPFAVVIPEPPRGSWTWGAPGELVVATTSVGIWETIEVRVDGVVVGTFTSTATSGETFAVTTMSASPVVTMNYAMGAAPAPRSIVPQL